MAASVDIPFDNIHPRVGVRVLLVEAGDYPIRPGSGFAPVSYGVLISWPRTIGPWFTVQAEAVGGRDAIGFGGEESDLLAMIARHKVEATPLAQEVAADGWARDNWFLIGSITRPAGVRLRFRVDTNSEKFVKDAQNATADGIPIPLTILYFDSTADQPDWQPVRVLLRPATPVRASRLLLALDIGNTSTTAAVLDPFDADADARSPLSARIPMLSAGLVPGSGGSVGRAAPGAPPIPSELRLDLFRTWLAAGDPPPDARRFPDLARFPADHAPNAVDYIVGDLVRLSPSARSVVMGAKRMGASRPNPGKPGTPAQFPTHPVAAAHRLIPAGGVATEMPDAPVALDVRAPLELIAARVFQHFREAYREWPAKVALTYPTTYSRHELRALRQAVQRGWLRMQAAGQTRGGPVPAEPELANLVRQLQEVVNGALDQDSQEKDPVIQLLVDEASAAAFFHLRRKIFDETDGGLAAFRYLYDSGLNMLLYDCGGGTTDIALVSAVVKPDLRTLHVTVRRRSGVRTFGGDDITRQVCRLLKARLANLVATERKRANLPVPPVVPLQPPANDKGWMKLADDLERFITATATFDPSDLLVPTRTLSAQPTERQQAAALALWRLGEQMKHALSAGPPAGATTGFTPIVEVKLPPLDRETNVLTQAIFPAQLVDRRADLLQLAEFRRKLEAITVTRTEIDAMVYKSVMGSIFNCNKLIHDVLEDSPGGVPEEVHWVVASGNAVRYPLLQKLLKQHLAVASLDDGRFTFDPDNAKDATAKGAALALATMESGGNQLDLRFDSDLHNRLPFNVGFKNARINGVTVLFAEHELYDDLAKRTKRQPARIALAELPAPNQLGTKQLVLLRQFPGDEGFSDFLAFEFPEGISGQHLLVSYDDSSEFEFRVTDGTTDGTARDLSGKEMYRAPALRGDI